MTKRAKRGKTQAPPTGLVRVGSLDEQLAEATKALGVGVRPRVFREMCRAMGAEHITVIAKVLDGTARQVVPVVVSDGKEGSHVEMVERGPTIAEQVMAWKAVADAGLKGVPQDADGTETVKRGVIRFPIPAEVMEIERASVKA